MNYDDEHAVSEIVNKHAFKFNTLSLSSNGICVSCVYSRMLT